MDATPTKTKQAKSLGEFTPLLRDPSDSHHTGPEFSLMLSPSFQNMRSKLITLDSDQESIAVSTPGAPARDSPILKRARFGSPPSPDGFGPDFLTRKLREASSQDRPQGTAQAHKNAPSTPPPSSTGGFDEVLVAKQNEINVLRTRLEEVEQQSYASADMARRKLQSHQEESTQRAQELEQRIQSLEFELKKSHAQHSTEKNALKHETSHLRVQLAEYENKVHDLDEKYKHEQEESRKARLVRDEAKTKASNFEKVANEFELMLGRARAAAEKAETKSIMAIKQADEATSVKAKLIEQVNQLQVKLEAQEEAHTEALQQKQREINQGKVKAKELMDTIKALELKYKTLELVEQKLREDNQEWQAISAEEKIKTKRVEDQLKVAKGEISGLKDDIQSNARVHELVRQVHELQDKIKHASGVLEERDKRIQALEYKLSDAGKSAELEVVHAQVSAGEQTAHRLGTEITLLQSKLREAQYALTSQQSNVKNLTEQIQIRDQSILATQRSISEMQSQLEQAQKDVAGTNCKFEELSWKYNQLYSQCSAEIEKIKDAARRDISQKDQALAETASSHVLQIEEIRRQCDQEILRRHHELEQKFIDLSSSSGTSLAEALRSQREELEHEYTDHVKRIDQSTEDRINKIRELAEVQVNEHKRNLESHFKVQNGRVEELEENAEYLQGKLDKTLKAFQLVLEYHAARQARDQFVLDDLVFIKGIAETCLDQIEQEDRHRLASLGIQYTPKRTFAGVATFVLAISRLHRISRPQIPQKLERDYDRFIRTQRLD